MQNDQQPWFAVWLEDTQCKSMSNELGPDDPKMI